LLATAQACKLLARSERCDEVPYVSANPTETLYGPSIGTGECVPLVQHSTGAPVTKDWRRGAPVKGNFDVQIGTAIATFDKDGRYGNHRTGNHAAIYMGQDAQGIMVVDQWNRRDKTGKIYGQQPPHIHMLLFDDRKADVDNGNRFYVVN
jgi:hypothetical protein